MSLRQLQIGDYVERYVVEALLGEGATARVYRVRHELLGTLHALKVLLVDGSASVDRMLQEARVQARLHHPHIVSVSDVLTWEGRPCLVMQFVDGPTLEQRVVQDGPLPWADAVAMMAPLVHAVAAAHELGVLHRDLKPGNVLLAPGTPAVPMVTDFGLAKVLAAGSPLERTGQTRRRVSMGTPGYMAPEQWADAATAGQPADVFGLAAVLYATIAAQAPFPSEGVASLEATVNGRFDPLDQVADCPPWLAAVVAKGLAVAPADRFDSAIAFGAALAAGGQDPPPGQDLSPQPAPPSATALAASPPTLVAPATAPPTLVAPNPTAADGPLSTAAPPTLVAPNPTAADGPLSTAAPPTLVAADPTPDPPPLPTAALPPPALNTARAIPLLFVATASSMLVIAVAAVVFAIVVGSPDTPIVQLPAMPFWRGDTFGNGAADERPTELVALAAFAMDRTEVRSDRYAECVSEGACTAHTGTARADDEPVTGISWDQAGAYCAWAGGRLPTEVEWEAAATWSRSAESSADKRRWPWGDDTPSCSLAHHEACEPAGPLPVDSLPDGQSAFGLVQMSGNVWEWTASSYPVKRGLLQRKVTHYVLRGGAWDSQPEFLRPTFRRHTAPGDARDNHGVRCAYDPS